MNKIRVQRIRPMQLPATLCMELMERYHAQIQDFVVMQERETQILYVNKTVPEKDVEGFVDYLMYSGKYIGEDKADFAEYVLETYGAAAYRALHDAWQYRDEQKKEEAANSLAAAFLPIIEREAHSDTPIIEFNERLVHKVWKKGYNPFDHKTPENMTSYGSVYVFYLGYLMGAGLVKGD